MSKTDSTRGQLTTKFGVIEFTRTQANHVALMTKSNSAGPIEVRGVKYNCNVHLYLLADGTWELRDYHSLYLSRSGYEKNSNKPASPSARSAVLVEFTTKWTEYVAAHPESANLAERGKLTDDLHRVAEQINELRASLKAAENKHAAILKTLKGIGGVI